MAHDGIALRDRFQDVVTSEAELRAIVGQPRSVLVDKVVRVIDEHCRRFITHAPFVFVASAGADGMIDVSPKGDPAGFVKVLDENTIAIPDRLGDRDSIPIATCCKIECRADLRNPRESPIRCASAARRSSCATLSFANP